MIENALAVASMTSHSKYIVATRTISALIAHRIRPDKKKNCIIGFPYSAWLLCLMVPIMDIFGSVVALDIKPAEMQDVDIAVVVVVRDGAQRLSCPSFPAPGPFAMTECVVERSHLDICLFGGIEVDRSTPCGGACGLTCENHSRHRWHRFLAGI